MGKNPTKKEIEDLKVKHGDELFQLSVPVNGKENVFILREVDRTTYKAGIAMAESDEMEAASMYLRALCVFGDVEPVIKNFASLRTAAGLLLDIVTPPKGNVVRL